MNCRFDVGTCTNSCPKYYLCMYNSMQEQISEIQVQLNFVLSTLGHLSCEGGIQKQRLNIAEANIEDLLSSIIEITNDSEPKQ